MTDEHNEKDRRSTKTQNDAEREFQVTDIIERIERLAQAAQTRVRALAARLRKKNSN